MELIAAIDAYFHTLELEANWHDCRCSGCSFLERALREVLQALRNREEEQELERLWRMSDTDGSSW